MDADAVQPDCGRFDWDTRAFAPGLDDAAVRALALGSGYLDRFGPNSAAGPVAEFMLLAFANLHDKAVAAGLGKRPFTAEDVGQVPGMCSFAYAASRFAAELAARVDRAEKTAADAARRAADLKAAVAGLALSAEFYAHVVAPFPDDECDEYDTMMRPQWRRVAELCGIPVGAERSKAAAVEDEPATATTAGA